MALDNLLAPHQEDNRRPSRVRLWHTHAYCMRKRQVEGTLRQHLGCCCFPALPLLVCARTHADPTVDTHRTHTHTHTRTHTYTHNSLFPLSLSLSHPHAHPPPLLQRSLLLVSPSSLSLSLQCCCRCCATGRLWPRGDSCCRLPAPRTGPDALRRSGCVLVSSPSLLGVSSSPISPSCALTVPFCEPINTQTHRYTDTHTHTHTHTDLVPCAALVSIVRFASPALVHPLASSPCRAHPCHLTPPPLPNAPRATTASAAVLHRPGQTSPGLTHISTHSEPTATRTTPWHTHIPPSPSPLQDSHPRQGRKRGSGLAALGRDGRRRRRCPGRGRRARDLAGGRGAAAAAQGRRRPAGH